MISCLIGVGVNYNLPDPNTKIFLRRDMTPIRVSSTKPKYYFHDKL
jgi:hypothetical protein